MYKLELIDEELINGHCSYLEDRMEYASCDPRCRETLNEIDRVFPGAKEKTSNLRRYYAQKRINDLARWRMFVRSDISAISNLAHMFNYGRRLRDEEQKEFRVELQHPHNISAGPLVFQALIYVNNKRHGCVHCEVTNEEIDQFSIGNRSLSKSATRQRKINENYRMFEINFPSHIEKKWKEGVDLTKQSKITWKDIRS